MIPGPFVVALAAIMASQDAVDPGQSEILVEGTRDRDRQIRSFVDALTPAGPGSQISRYHRQVCPAASGLSEPQNRKLVDRMRAVAKAAGIRVGREPCEPNALVFVVDDKDEFIGVMRAKYPNYFSTDPKAGTDSANVASPAAAWHVEGVLDANGMEAGVRTQNAREVAIAGGGSSKVSEGTNVRYTENTDSSRLKLPSQPYFVSGVLVIERSALAGLTTTQLADYAAMRLYSDADPARLPGDAVSTILSVLEAPMGKSLPITLTAWDLAFLKSLYATESLQSASQQRNAINQRMRRELEAELADKR